MAFSMIINRRTFEFLASLYPPTCERGRKVEQEVPQWSTQAAATAMVDDSFASFGFGPKKSRVEPGTFSTPASIQCEPY